MAALLFPLLVSLGFWQLDRAQEKRQLQQLVADRQLAAAVPIEQLWGERDLHYQRVKLRGEFVNDKPVYLDNRIYRKRFGYEIISPFKLLDSERLVWVNRGWIEGDRSRRTLPEVEAVNGVVALEAEVYMPEGALMRLGGEAITGWPRVLQSLDIPSLKGGFSEDVFPYTVRLKGASPGLLQPNWMVVNIQPEKHTGYAFQWFAMSFTLIVIGLLANSNAWALFKARGQ